MNENEALKALAKAINFSSNDVFELNVNRPTWQSITAISELKRGDIIRNADYDVFRVNGNFGDGAVIADVVDNNIEILTDIKGWSKRNEHLSFKSRTRRFN